MSFERKPKCVVLNHVISTSGKYRLFYGYHYLQGKPCYDVGTTNQLSGEIISRHYPAKDEALACYHVYARELTKPRRSEEREDNDARIADMFRKMLMRG